MVKFKENNNFYFQKEKIKIVIEKEITRFIDSIIFFLLIEFLIEFSIVRGIFFFCLRIRHESIENTHVNYWEGLKEKKLARKNSDTCIYAENSHVINEMSAQCTAFQSSVFISA